MKKFSIMLLSLIPLSLLAQKQLGTDTIRMEVTVQQGQTIVDTNVLNTDFVIIDVRTPAEYIGGHIANAINIDYYSPTFGAQLSALDHNKMFLIHCAAGSRSPKARDTMIKQHFREIYHMYQGISAWIGQGYPTVTGYTTIAESSLGNNINIYAQPIEKTLMVRYNAEKPGTIRICDLLGKSMHYSVIESGLQHYNVTAFPQGLYIIRIQADNEVFTVKIML